MPMLHEQPFMISRRQEANEVLLAKAPLGGGCEKLLGPA